MNIQIEFFKNNLIESINEGIYKISIVKNGKSKCLYIGESVFVMVRCASHLYNFTKNPEYFGFSNEHIKDPEIKVIFELIELCNNKSERKKKELELIKSIKPVTQSGVGDRMKKIDEKIESLKNVIESLSTIG